MIQCPECGKLLAPGSIHTCSPQVVEDFPDARLPDVAAPSGWLTRPPHEAPWQADDQEAWFGEAVAQRDRAVAAEAMVAGRDSEMEAAKKKLQECVVQHEELRDATTAECAQLMARAVALRQLAEEAITTVHQSCGAVCGCVGTACRNTNRLRARLAEIGGGE